MTTSRQQVAETWVWIPDLRSWIFVAPCEALGEGKHAL